MTALFRGETPETPVAFLTARYDEAEAEATSKPADWLYVDPGNAIEMVGAGPGHVLAVGPAWVLADLAAKRSLLELAVKLLDGEDAEPWFAEELLVRLALPYAGHPDYRQEWTP